MKVCFVTNSNLNEVWQDKLNDISNQDIIVFGYNSIGLVCYKKELSGETEYFQDLAKLSKQIGSVIVLGCDTDTYGVFRHSAVIADNGKILGVSDMVYQIDESEFASGGSFKVYDSSVGKIGILIMEDLYFFESSRILSLCDADLIICLFKRLEGHMAELMLRCNSYANGVSMALCAKNMAFISDMRGKIVCSSCADLIKSNIKIQKDYHLISSKRRGLFRDFNSEG